MKNLILILAVAAVATGVGLYLGSQRPQSYSPPAPEFGSEVPAAANPAPESAPRAAVPTHSPKPLPAAATAVDQVATAAAPSPPATTAAKVASVSLGFNQAVDALLAKDATFERKQAAWHELRDSGKLDQAIAEFERRAAEDPRTAEYPAALGQACLQKAGTIKDLREQGILGMKADQSFDAALNLDPDNWEARFWKAAAMSYWPLELGKGKEVLERFLDLVQRQESGPAQPQFAQTYMMLGNQYQKMGSAEYARQIWERGAALFPNDSALREKLAAANQPAAPTPQVANAPAQ